MDSQYFNYLIQNQDNWRQQLSKRRDIKYQQFLKSRRIYQQQYRDRNKNQKIDEEKDEDKKIT